MTIEELHAARDTSGADFIAKFEALHKAAIELGGIEEALLNLGARSDDIRTFFALDARTLQHPKYSVQNVHGWHDDIHKRRDEIVAAFHRGS